MSSVDGDVPVYEKSRRKLFQVKLDSEIPIGGFVEIARVQVEFETLLAARADMNVLEYSSRMRDCCIRFITLWMFDYVPDEVVENLTQDSLEKAVDFLYGLMSPDVQKIADQERARLQALAA